MNEYIVTIEGIKKNIRFVNGTEIFVDQNKYDYEILKLSAGSYLLRLNNNFYEIPALSKNSETAIVNVGGETYEVTVRSALQEKAASLIEQQNAGTRQMVVKAPMPGMIVKIKMPDGSSVAQNDAVIILEAMKMENEVRSPFTGILKTMYVKEGMAVEKGANLFLIE